LAYEKKTSRKLKFIEYPIEYINIKAYIIVFIYLGSILEATGATTLEIEKRISEGRRVIGMLNSVLWSKSVLHKTKKTHVPGFSPKYFTIWGRNMDTKHTTGTQITGN
jgi:hypothetical protein